MEEKQGTEEQKYQSPGETVGKEQSEKSKSRSWLPVNKQRTGKASKGREGVGRKDGVVERAGLESEFESQFLSLTR